MKNPSVAFILSIILPGAGLVYLGKWGWGVINLAAVIGAGVAAAAFLPGELIQGYSGYVAMGLNGVSGWLAQTQANRMNQAEQPR